MKESQPIHGNDGLVPDFGRLVADIFSYKSGTFLLILNCKQRKVYKWQTCHTFYKYFGEKNIILKVILRVLVSKSMVSLPN